MPRYIAPENSLPVINASLYDIPKSRQVIGVAGIVLLLFSVTFGLPYLFRLAPSMFPLERAFWISRVSYWICLLALVAYATRVERTHIVTWNERPLSPAEGLATVFMIPGAVMIGLLILGMVILFGGFKEDQSKLLVMLDLFRQDKALFIVTVITAGIVEELIFRAYILPRLAYLFNNSFLAVFVSSALFGLLHLGWGYVSQVIGPFWIGMVIGAHYREYRNLKALIIFHTGWDLASILLQMLIHGYKLSQNRF